jgi:hypothetical protein
LINSALLIARDDFADLAGNVLFAYEPLGQRHIDLAVGPALADVVDENAGDLIDVSVLHHVALSAQLEIRKAAMQLIKSAFTFDVFAKPTAYARRTLILGSRQRPAGLMRVKMAYG